MRLACLWIAVGLAGCFSPNFEGARCGGGDACAPGLTCTPLGLCATCGDGRAEHGEECDDGNSNDEDDCTSHCRLNICGDQIVNRLGATPEACDEGGVDTATCNANCTAVACGDGYQNVAAGEVCDDSNMIGGDGCAATCRSNEKCGNGILDGQLPNNVNNKPLLCGTSTTQNTNCAEACDDGNTIAGDGCSANCLSNETCGNGIVDSAVGEVCDDGNHLSGDGCAADCKSGLGCGNGVIDPGEQCDEGMASDTATCNSGTCTIPKCGDGHVNSPAGEQCDNGQPGVNTASCDRDCTQPVCGDLLVNLAAGEQCEPPSQGTCKATCTF